MPHIPDYAATDAWRTCFTGGALLLATVVVRVAIQPGFLGAGIIGTALYSASLLVFAFGIRGSGSVTARRPLGTAALTVLAVWVLLGSVLADVFAFSFSNDAFPGALLEFGYVDSFVQFAAALVAVTQIARAGVVPRPWNWAPAWVLVAVCVPWLLSQIVAAGAAQEAPFMSIMVVGTVDGLVRIGGAVFLGVLAIVLADRSSRPQVVTMYPKSDQPPPPTSQTAPKTGIFGQ